MLGKTVQNFVLRDQAGREFDLYKNLDKNILLVFYPKDNSPVCSKQLLDYCNHKKKFEEKNIKVVAINTGTKEQHLAFCKSLEINIPLLSDVTKEVSRRFDALNIIGINKRKLVLIGTNKKVIFEKSSIPITFYDSQSLLKMISEVSRS